MNTATGIIEADWTRITPSRLSSRPSDLTTTKSGASARRMGMTTPMRKQAKMKVDPRNGMRANTKAVEDDTIVTMTTADAEMIAEFRK